jgi:hypothetical protein
VPVLIDEDDDERSPLLNDYESTSIKPSFLAI